MSFYSLGKRTLDISLKVLDIFLYYELIAWAHSTITPCLTCALQIQLGASCNFMQH